jgi:hypothetical protein
MMVAEDDGAAPSRFEQAAEQAVAVLGQASLSAAAAHAQRSGEPKRPTGAKTSFDKQVV